uniref:Uncharacterized protein n=1 Tax=Arundo donax TaxID=35708 RepID=A0A0A9B3A9_ARUDO
MSPFGRLPVRSCRMMTPRATRQISAERSRSAGTQGPCSTVCRRRSSLCTPFASQAQDQI